jgi:hypothetical protein
MGEIMKRMTRHLQMLRQDVALTDMRPGYQEQ